MVATSKNIFLYFALILTSETFLSGRTTVSAHNPPLVGGQLTESSTGEDAQESDSSWRVKFVNLIDLSPRPQFSIENSYHSFFLERFFEPSFVLPFRSDPSRLIYDSKNDPPVKKVSLFDSLWVPRAIIFTSYEAALAPSPSYIDDESKSSLDVLDRQPPSSTTRGDRGDKKGRETSTSSMESSHKGSVPATLLSRQKAAKRYYANTKRKKMGTTTSVENKKNINKNKPIEKPSNLLHLEQPAAEIVQASRSSSSYPDYRVKNSNSPKVHKKGSSLRSSRAVSSSSSDGSRRTTDRYVREKAYREATSTLLWAEDLMRQAEQVKSGSTSRSGSTGARPQLRGATTTSAPAAETVRLYFYNALVTAESASPRPSSEYPLSSSGGTTTASDAAEEDEAEDAASDSSEAQEEEGVDGDEEGLEEEEEEEEEEEGQAIEDPVVVFGYSVDGGVTYRFLDAIALNNYMVVNDVPKVANVLFGLSVYSAAEYETMPSPLGLSRTPEGEDEIVFDSTGVALVQESDTAVAIIAMYEDEDRTPPSPKDEVNSVRCVSKHI